MFEVAKDVLLHVKTKIEEKGVVKETVFPATRWENVLGAPRVLTKDNVADSFPAEYAIFITGDVVISDEEYDACFPDLR